jgi:hypothetical protein
VTRPQKLHCSDQRQTDAQHYHWFLLLRQEGLKVLLGYVRGGKRGPRLTLQLVIVNISQWRSELSIRTTNNDEVVRVCHCESTSYMFQNMFSSQSTKLTLSLPNVSTDLPSHSHSRGYARVTTPRTPVSIYTPISTHVSSTAPCGNVCCAPIPPPTRARKHAAALAPPHKHLGTHRKHTSKRAPRPLHLSHLSSPSSRAAGCLSPKRARRVTKPGK